MKRITCFLVTFLVLVLSCAPLVFAFAEAPTNAVPTISVPFTKPDLPYVMCVWLNNNTGKFLARMWTFNLFISSGSAGTNEVIDPSQVQYTCGFDFTSADGVYNNVVAYARFATIISSAITSSTQFYTATIGNDYYRIYDNSGQTVNGHTNPIELLKYNNVSLDNYTLYGCFFGNGFVMENPEILENKIDVAFSDAINQSTINEALDLLYSLDWQLYDIYYLVDLIDGKITLVNEKLDKIVEILEDMHNVTPSETTTNGAVDELDKAEGDLMDDAFGNLDKVDMPTIQFNPGTNTGDAFLFIGSQLEALTSNAKFRTAIMIILSLSLCGFLLKILPNKGD